jgi:FkbM family methyltransferase
MLPSPLLGRLKSWRFRRQIARYGRRVVTHTYGSAPLSVLLADPIGASWYDHDWAELPEFALLREGRLRAGARVFDIGAHQGVVGLMLAREVGPSGVVVGVEPSAHNFAVAQRNCELNRPLPLTLVHAAASDRSGLLTFEQGFDPQVDDGRRGLMKFQARAVTVDELAAEHGPPDVLFIDVEGFECQVLRGAGSVLRARPDCFIEAHVGHGLEKFGSVAELLSFFPSKRYERFVRGWAMPTFRTLTDDDSLVAEPFVLVALAKSRTPPAAAR